MPNTIAHLGLHALCTKSIYSKADIKWIYLGAVLPDLPFVLKRAISALVPRADILDFRLLAIVQASLLFSIVLAFACSRFSAKSSRVFLVLCFGVFLHLLIDACQIKWGNGPRFLVPIDWSIANFGLFWPEQLPSHIITGIGGLYAIYSFVLPIRSQGQDLVLPARKSFIAFVVAIIFYSFLPLALLDAAEQAGGGGVRVIRMDDRTGQEILLDRARYRQEGDKTTVELYAGHFIDLTSIDADLPISGKISVKGLFITNDVIQANEYHLNDAHYRELASVLGLSVVAVYWLLVLPGLRRDT